MVGNVFIFRVLMDAGEEWGAEMTGVAVAEGINKGAMVTKTMSKGQQREVYELR